MKATKKIIAVLACAFALCFALVGCSSDAEQYKKNFQGDWELAGLTEGDTTYSESDISMLKAWGMEVKMSLNEDETMVLEYFGEKVEGNWEPKDAGMISSEIDGAEMKFKKME